MRTAIATIIAIVSLSMVSCSMNEGIEEYSLEDLVAMNEGGEYEAQTKAVVNFSDSAFVRIGMYNCVGNYNLKVSNLRVLSSMPSSMLPVFGQEIEQAGNLSVLRSQAAYDTAGGRYHSVVPTYEGSNITLLFDVTLEGTNDNGGQICLTDVRYVITSDQTLWEEGHYYDYVIGLTPEVLDLDPIEFNAVVEDFQNGVDVEC